MEVVQGSLSKEGVKDIQIVVANISAKVLIELAVPLTATLDSEGLLIASGFLDERFGDVMQSFNAAGLSLVKRRDVQDWVAVVLSRLY